ncbi:Disease resistance-like protein DSC1 [Citrus sinensis]|nr:Disease resistance-like protein DSC1 [Citrus sinensis]
MVNYADGLPLALEIMGSFLFGMRKAEWKDALDRLKYVPDQKIFEILKISYDGLQETEKKIFLDIACFFKGNDKDQIWVWKLFANRAQETQVNAVGCDFGWIFLKCSQKMREQKLLKASYKIWDYSKSVILPSSISDLRSFKVLNLNGSSKLEEVPENLGHIASLENLDLGGTTIRRPPSTIVLLENLKELSFHGCKGQRKSWSSLIWLPFYPRANRDSLGFFIPSLSGLHCLSRLDLGDCNLQEGAIPNDLGSLSALTNFTLSRNNFFSLPASINQLSRLETLNIDYCNRLKALPELPASIDGLFAHNCTSLIKLCSPSNITRLTPRMFYLSNCFKLTGNMAIIFVKSLLQSLLKSQLRGLKSAVTSSEFDIVIPGSQVPEWFTYQSIEQSITIIPPIYCFNSFMGLAFCTAFSIHQHSSFLSHVSAPSNTLYLELVLEINGWHRHSVSISFDVNSLAQFNHLWLCYVSKSYFAAPEYPNPIKASVAARDHIYMKLKVKAFGLCFVFDQDVEEFIRSSTAQKTSQVTQFVSKCSNAWTNTSRIQHSSPGTSGSCLSYTEDQAQASKSVDHMVELLYKYIKESIDPPFS